MCVCIYIYVCTYIFCMFSVALCRGDILEVYRYKNSYRYEPASSPCSRQPEPIKWKILTNFCILEASTIST